MKLNITRVLDYFQIRMDLGYSWIYRQGKFVVNVACLYEPHILFKGDGVF